MINKIETDITLMVDLNNINLQLKKRMNKERYKHSCQVSKVAEKIAEHYKISTFKAKLVGLIHDCAKDYSLEELKVLIRRYKIKLNDIEKKIPSLWHAFVGAELARDIFHINNKDMIDAIKYHSTGYRYFGTLGKIIYISDKIEPDRGFARLEKIREMVWENIDLAMLELLNQEIKSLIDRNAIIHPETLYTRNKIIIEKRNKLADE